MKIKRGQIYIADLNDIRGSEQGGIRPVLILQNNIANTYSPTTIVACITTKINGKAHLPTHIYVPESIGLDTKSMIMLEQIRTIDISRLQNYVGSLTKNQMVPINKRLAISLELNNKKGFKYERKRNK